MKYETIGDIYSAHDKVRERFISVAKSVSENEATSRPDGEKWSVQQVIEHVSIVEAGMNRLCSKLIEAARDKGSSSDGKFAPAPDFGERMSSIADKKLEAPDRVHPSGDVTIAESLHRLEATTASISELRSDLERYDGAGFTFPHPYLGELTAAEWLAVRVGHEHRHTKQIERVLELVRT